MLSKSIKEIARENGWYGDGNLLGGAFGLYKNYFFMIKEGMGDKVLTARFDEINEETWINLNQAIEKNKKKLKISEFGVGIEGLWLKFVEHVRNTKKEVLYTALDFLVELFEENHMPHQNKCIDCGTQKDLAYYTLGEVAGMVCPSCYIALREEMGHFERGYQSEDKNYMMGTIGAILYSVPGIIVWVIIALFLRAISGVMVLGIGFLAFKGFADFGGRAGVWSKWIVVAVTIVATIVAIFASVFVGLFFNGYGYQEIINQILTNEEVQRYIKGSLYFAALLGAIPLIYIFYEIYSLSRVPKLKEAKKIA
jgi:hypothetical protein